MMMKRKLAPWVGIVLTWVVCLMSACSSEQDSRQVSLSSEQDPRQVYLDTLTAEFDALVGFLKEFEPGMETREVELEGSNGRVTRADRIVSGSKDIADTFQALHQHIKRVPLPVLQKGMPSFDEWSRQAVTIIEAGRDRVEPELVRIMNDYSADPDRYAGNVELGPEGMLFISSSQISMLGGLSTSEPEGFGIDPMFLWKMDLEAWVAGIHQESERFALED